MMAWFKSEKPRPFLIGGRKADTRIDGVLPHQNKYMPVWLDKLPFWAIAGMFLTGPLFLFALGFVLIFAPLEALGRWKSNSTTGGFIEEYHHAILGWNHLIELRCGGEGKRVRISGLDIQSVRLRAEYAYPGCHTRSILKTCSSSRRGWISQIICTPDKHTFAD